MLEVQFNVVDHVLCQPSCTEGAGGLLRGEVTDQLQHPAVVIHTRAGTLTHLGPVGWRGRRVLYVSRITGRVTSLDTRVEIETNSGRDQDTNDHCYHSASYGETSVHSDLYLTELLRSLESVLGFTFPSFYGKTISNGLFRTGMELWLIMIQDD